VCVGGVWMWSGMYVVCVVEVWGVCV